MGFFLSFFFFPLIGATGYLGYRFFQEQKLTWILKAEITQRLATAAGQENRITEIEAEVNRLSPYSVIPDVEAQAAAIIQAAEKQSREVTTKYENYAKEVTDWATQAFEFANKQADRLIIDARRQEEDALQHKTEYENIAQAMRNVIQGYGDQYVVPSQSLLDDMAEEFSYVQAGVELKKARPHTREMVRQKTAATCDYSEGEQHDAAVRFVIDAFNGKVDSALADIKADNAGTLEQEIKDAFALVNYSSKGFLKARVTEGFLMSRLSELKWAAIAQQLRVQERQEQNRIREQMREEEKARKEYEKANKEAAYQQQVLQRAMETAKQQVQNASAEERSKYEQKLNELSQQLQEAHEKGQKAISMAQQTKKWHVYIISNIGSFGENVYKIGQTRRLEPKDRIDELGGSSVPFDFDIHAMISTDDAPGLERQMHKLFVFSQINKVNPRKEFFRIDIAFLKEQIDKLGYETRWTMTSEAIQHRESIALDKKLSDNPAFKASWLQKQVHIDPLAQTKQVSDEEADS